MADIPLTIFYSYADEDEELRLKLENHLSNLRREGMIEEWQRKRLLQELIKSRSAMNSSPKPPSSSCSSALTFSPLKIAVLRCCKPGRGISPVMPASFLFYYVRVIGKARLSPICNTCRAMGSQ